MGNRKKLRIKGRRNNSLRQKRTEVPGRGLMQVAGRLFSEDHRQRGEHMYPTPDEMFAKDIPESEQEKIEKFWRSEYVKPASNEPVIKVVDARVGGVRVGDAFIHEDGQVSLVFDADAPQEQLDIIKAQGEVVGYNVETGTPTDGPS